jgi:holliday junction DNA helicase RuvA
MIRSLRGSIEELSADSIVLAVGPVSLRVYVPAPTLASAGGAGQDIRLFTHLQVREDQWSLFGFATEDERRWFELLLGVNGVGPRVALNILSALSLETLRDALSRGDAAPLTRVPGVGKKVAGRLVLELQSKVGAAGTGDAGMPGGDGSSGVSDLIDALTNLGYTTGEAQTALRAIPTDGERPLEDTLLLALRHLASR